MDGEMERWIVIGHQISLHEPIQDRLFLVSPIIRSSISSAFIFCFCEYFYIKK